MPDMQKKLSAAPIYVMGTHHFDPIWRRGFLRAFEWKGQKYVGNQRIEDACLEDWLEICRESDAVFEIECTLVLRTFLEKHPERLEEVRALIKSGRIELRASGEVIPDTNLPIGETLVRNLVYGLLWANEVLGAMPETGCLNDAFGSSAQLPQILRGCGIRVVAGLSYATMDRKYWRGLDGSIVRAINNPGNEPYSKFLGPGTYYRPCPACAGAGCDACRNRGFDQSFRMRGSVDSKGLDLSKTGYGIIFVGGEEAMPPLDLAARVAQAHEIGIDFRFGLLKDILREWEPLSDSPPEADISTRVEANPAQTGCYTSRIRIKQRLRALEHDLLAAETLAALCWLSGGDYPAEALLTLWRNAAFAAFHDNVTGTHVDVGYEELMARFDESEALLNEVRAGLLGAGDSAWVFNPFSFPASGVVLGKMLLKDVPPLGFQALPMEPPGEDLSLPLDAAAENEYYLISFDAHGVTGIFDKLRGAALIRGAPGYANELILEHDVGDPWSTREIHRPRTRLGRMGTVVSNIRRGALREVTIEGAFQGNEDLLSDPADYRVLALKWRQVVRLWEGLGRVEFETEIDWSAFDRRIRVSFPTFARGDDGYYAIPYGVLKRSRYDKTDRPGVANPDGDWPATQFFATAQGENAQVALMNRGTPSARIERGELLMTLLRSPTFPGGGLLWPEFYDAPVYGGMRDAGRHTFHYALTSFSGDEYGETARQAQVFGGGLTALSGVPTVSAAPGLSAQGVNISAMKRSEDGLALIIRLSEFAGRGEEAALTLPFAARIWKADLLERPQEALRAENGVLKVALRPFEILTLRIENGGS